MKEITHVADLGPVIISWLLALIFGFDVAFVAFHHTVRIIPLIFAMSFISKRLPDTKKGPYKRNSSP